MTGPYDPRQDPQQQGGYQQGGYQQGPQGGYQQGEQGGYPQQGGYQQGQQGGYPQGQQGGYPQGGYQQGPQGGYPQGPQGGYPQPPRRNGLVLGIAAIVAVVVAAAVVLIIVLNKDDTNTANAGNPGGTGQQSAPVPPAQNTGGDKTTDEKTTDDKTTDDKTTDQTDKTDGGGSSEDDGVIRSQTEKFFQAVKGGDWDTVSSLICEDKREAITKELQSEIGSAGAGLEYKVDTVDVSGGTASVHITLTIAGKNEGTTVKLTKDTGEWLLCSF